jgi:hypothetical protein
MNYEAFKQIWDVDEKNKKIYGISDDPDYQIIEFSYD